MSIISRISEPVKGLIGASPKFSITSRFQKNRVVNGVSADHLGIDIGVLSGIQNPPVFSVSRKDSIVIRARFQNDGYGNSVVLDHGDGWYSLYGHLDSICHNVNEGQILAAGSQVGFMGDTGYSFGTHLHLEYYTKDTSLKISKIPNIIKDGFLYINPEYFFYRAFDTGNPEIEPDDSLGSIESKYNKDDAAIKSYVSFRWNNVEYLEKEETLGEATYKKYEADNKNSTLQDFIDLFKIILSDSESSIDSKDSKKHTNENINKSSKTFTLYDFLNYTGEVIKGKDANGNPVNTLTNAERITMSYTDKTLSAIGGIGNLYNFPANKIHLAPGTELRVPAEQISYTFRQPPAPYNVEKFNGETEVFFDDKVKKLLNSKLYRLNSTDYTTTTDLQYGTLHKMSPEATVWVFARKLGNGGELINISPYIISLNTTVAHGGGNFQIELSPIIGECFCKEVDKYGKGVWTYKSVTQSANESTKEHIAKVSVNKVSVKNNAIERNNFFFDMALGSQDLVFIRFEPLLGEALYPNDFKIDKNTLHGKNWDLIGLIDNTSHSVTPPNEVSISISGRDLTKLFIDDQHYYFTAPAYVKDTVVFTENGGNVEGFSVARTSMGYMENMIPYKFYSIQNTMNYYLSALQNTVIVPQDFFSSYGNERSKRFIKQGDKPTDGKHVANLKDLEQVEAGNIRKGEKALKISTNGLEEEFCIGIWQIIKVAYDSKISNRVLVNGSPQTDTGSIINFLEKLCQFPFVELMFDTWGDTFYVHARQPPFNYKGYNALRKLAKQNSVIKNDMVYSEVLGVDDRDVVTAFQILPIMNLGSSSVTVFNNKIPAVIFDEYVKIYGLKFWQLQSNYIGLDNGVNSEESINTVLDNLRIDLSYLVESTLYNPFVRKGEIVINGDRKIKRGQAVYYEPTGEIFHVDSVTQSYSINNGSPDRVTILHVSHGMVDAHFEKYFKIAEFGMKDVPREVVYEKQIINLVLHINFEYDCHFGVDAYYDGVNKRYPEPNSKNSLGYIPSAGIWYFVNEEIKRYVESGALPARIELQQRNQKEIERAAKKLIENPEMRMTITGHTDSDGTEAYNMQLSQRRALWTAHQITLYVQQHSIKKEREKLGMTNVIKSHNIELCLSILERLDFVGAGEMYPVTGNVSGGDSSPSQPTGQKQQNRRITARGYLDSISPCESAPSEKMATWTFNKETFDFLLRNKQFCECA